MHITRLAVNHFTATIVLVVFAVLLGALSIYKLPLQLLPNIERPQVQVFYAWPSSSPEELESVIMEPQERLLKNLPGLMKIESYITQGVGEISLTFEIDQDMNTAMLSVISRLNQAPSLPLNAEEPVVISGMSGRDTGATLMIVPKDANRLQSFIPYQQLIKDHVYPALMKIQGVANVTLASELQGYLRIEFLPEKLAQMQLTITDLVRVVSQAVDMSGGYAAVGKRRYTVRFSGQYDLSSVDDLIVTWINDRPIRLREIAKVSVAHEEQREVLYHSGVLAYLIYVNRENDSNTVELLDQVKATIATLNQDILGPQGLEARLSFDASTHIRNAIDLVVNNLSFGVVLALLALWLFLRGWRPILIIGMSIPVSLTVVFISLNLFNLSLNVISLAGIALAVGLVLDAAIIVQENISRLRSHGIPSKQAAISGATQVSSALIASTVTSIAIFAPIVFMNGIAGQLFTELALTLSVSVVFSLIAALTVIPMLSVKCSKGQAETERYERFWEWLTAGVMKLTEPKSARLLWITLLVVGTSIIAVWSMPKADLMPRAPIDALRGRFTLPPGSSITFIRDEIAKEINQRLAPYLSGEAQPQIKSYNLFSGLRLTGIYVYPEDPTQVDALKDKIDNHIFKDFMGISAYSFQASMLPTVGEGAERMVNINITGAELTQLIDAASVGVDVVKEVLPGAVVYTSPELTFAEPVLSLSPNEQRITQSGLQRSDVGNAIKTFTGGLFTSEYFDGNERFDVYLRTPSWKTPEQLIEMPIYTPLAGTLPLGELITMNRTTGPQSIIRLAGKRTVSIHVVPPENISIEEVMQLVKQQISPKIKAQLPNTGVISFDGEASELKETIGDMLVNFSLALMVLLGVLFIIFGSIRDSLLVLAVMPLSVFGGVFALHVLNLFTYQALDLLTMIGFIILLGLVVNNAILLVERTRQAEQDGLPRKMAVALAVRWRARPIFMSTLTSILGMSPLMMMPGEGAEIYQGLATVIVGGMAISGAFSLILMPSLLRMGETDVDMKDTDYRSISQNANAIGSIL